jgi:hypothetical protein
MTTDGTIMADLLGVLSGYTTIGLLVWVLVLLGLIGFLVSLFKGRG